MNDAQKPDLFADKAGDWDATEMVTALSAAIGAAMLKQVTLHDQMTVLDFGAGTGLVTSHIAPKVKRILAVDTSEAMLAKLAAKEELQGKVETVCQDITEKPLNKTFDVIVSAMAMHHVEDTDLLLTRFASHLRQGAHLALADLDQEDGSFHPAEIEGVFHAGFDRETLTKKLTASGFEAIEFTTAHTIEKEGTTYPVFLVTAQKA